MRFSPHDQSDPFARGALLFITAIICILTWQKWGMLTIDCGHEMYLPAALSEGKRLYFDVWYPYGPLIPYWHALLFRLFGIHLWLLETAGIVIVGLMTLVAYSLSRMFLPVSLSFAAGLAFVVQAFQLHLFNYVLPYSYPAAYGALMFVILTWLVVKDGFAEKSWTILAAGSIAGLEAITKIEFGMAAYILVVGAILMRAWRTRSAGRLVKDAALTMPGVLLWMGVYGWYVRASSVAFIFEQNITLLPGSYFVQTVGRRWMDIVGFTTSPVIIADSALVGLLGVAVVAAGVRVASSSRMAGWLVTSAALSICALQLSVVYAEKLLHRPLPTFLTRVGPFVYFNSGMIFVSVALAVWTFVRWLKGARGGQESALLLLLTAAIALGSRTLVGVQPTGYSIFYDTIAFIAFLIALKKLAGLFRVPDSARLWMWTSALLCCGLVSLTVAYYPVHRRSYPIRSQRGSAYMEPVTGQVFAQTLAFLNEAKARSQKFVVWPEEVALYYFTGTLAPNRWWYVIPGIVSPGELTSRFLQDLDRQQVEYVVLSDRSTPEYGLPIFGVDYDQQMYRWLEQNFRVIRTIGDYQRVTYPPHWAVQIWQRKRATDKEYLH
jgi:hypothetical protein